MEFLCPNRQRQKATLLALLSLPRCSPLKRYRSTAFSTADRLGCVIALAINKGLARGNLRQPRGTAVDIAAVMHLAVADC